MLAQKSREISDILRKSVATKKAKLKELSDEIEKTTKEFRTAAAQGDHSENAAYTESMDKITRLNTQKARYQDEIDSIQHINGDGFYVPTGVIKEYSTVSCTNLKTGEEMVFKIFPLDIGDMNNGILSSFAPAYKRMVGKKAGDVFYTIHNVTKEKIDFMINDIY